MSGEGLEQQQPRQGWEKGDIHFKDEETEAHRGKGMGGGLEWVRGLLERRQSMRIKGKPEAWGGKGVILP